MGRPDAEIKKALKLRDILRDKLMDLTNRELEILRNGTYRLKDTLNKDLELLNLKSSSTISQLMTDPRKKTDEHSQYASIESYEIAIANLDRLKKLFKKDESTSRERDELKEELQKERKKKERLKKDNQKLQKKIDGLKGSLEQIIRQLEEKDSQLRDLEIDNEKLQNNNEDLKQITEQLERTERQLRDTQKELDNKKLSEEHPRYDRFYFFIRGLITGLSVMFIAGLFFIILSYLGKI